MGGTETQGGVNNAGAMGIYDPNFNYGGYHPLMGIEKGFKILGESVAQGGQAPNFITSQAGYSSMPFGPPQGESSSPLIPVDSGDDEIIMAIRRLLSGGGSNLGSGFKVV